LATPDGKREVEATDSRKTLNDRLSVPGSMLKTAVEWKAKTRDEEVARLRRVCHAGRRPEGARGARRVRALRSAHHGEERDRGGSALMVSRVSNGAKIRGRCDRHEATA
jgi:hypothetical protein